LLAYKQKERMAAPCETGRERKLQQV
jgi:hypothetical protein